MAVQALGGVKVIEYCTMVSGPYCTKIMADMGAEVIKIEVPGLGDEARSMAPFLNDLPHPERSGLFFYLNSNKLGMTLDIKKPEGKEIFKKLVEDADVLVEDRPFGEMEALGLGYDDLKEINPGLIMTSITPFGRSGPYKDYKAYQLNISHVSGQGYLLPVPLHDLERPPVKTGGNISDYDPALMGMVGVLSALYRKMVTGRGQFIELSKQEALISMQRVESVTFANHGVIMGRGGNSRQMVGGVLPCKDGYICVLTVEEHQWQALVELVGDPEWKEQDWYKELPARIENAGEINRRLAEWAKDKTKEEIFRKGQALSCPVSPLYSAEDLVKSEQLNSREFFVEVEHPEMGRLKFPTAPYKFSESPWSFDRPAPLLGQHNEEILCGRLGYARDQLAGLKESGVI